MSREIREAIKGNIKIVDYARKIGFTPKKVGRYYTLKEHDSVRIDPVKNIFWQNSTGKSGSVIDFSIAFEGKTLAEALRDFEKDIKGYSVPERRYEIKLTKKPEAEKILCLPQRDSTMKNVIAYLTKTRMIDKKIVEELISRKMLYQDIRKNCVFVSYKEGKAVFATLRGTNTYKKFVGDCGGCDYSYGFFIDNHAKILIITESVIDAMSKMDQLAASGNNFHDYNFLSLSGTAKFEPLLDFHMANSNYEKVIIATDNDTAGLLCAINIDKYLYTNEYDGKITKEIPIGKDINEDLIKMKSR